MKWEKEFNLEVNSNWWKTKNSLIFKVTNDIQIRWFQYRIMRRILLQTHFYVKLELQTRNYVHSVMNIQKL